MRQDSTDPGTKGVDRDAGRPPVPPAAPEGEPAPPEGELELPAGEPNGTPVDLGSRNPDPNAHNWLHPENDLQAWDTAFDSTQDTSEPYPDEVGASGDADPRTENQTRQRVIIGVIVAVIMVIMGVTIWLLVNMLSSGPQQIAQEPSPEQSASEPPLPRDVNAMDFKLGDCFSDFDSEANSAMAVACDTAHSAQLVAVHQYGAEDNYPGRETLKAKAEDSCKSAKLSPKASDYPLKFQLVYPSPTSWEKGDRRVDCFVVADNGNTITENLIQ